MADGYKVPKSGLDALVEKFAGLERQVNALRSAAGILSAVIGKGGITVKDGGGISLLDGGQIQMSAGSKFVVFGDDTYVQILDDSFSIGTVVDGELTRPAMILQPDGFLAAISDTEFAVFRVDETDGAAIISSSINKVRLPYTTTSDAANTRILFDGTIQMVGSSLRYKRDVEDAPVDVDAFLNLRPRSWRDRGLVEEDPDTTRRSYGFIAEEVAELGLPFVDFDAEGRPDSLQYDRFMVGAVQVMQSQADQIKTLSERLDALENKTN